jgi:hypothetical protein
MIKKSQLKVGVLIWWTANRTFKKWDCPAIVTKVSRKYFKVKSLDDFKETENLRMDDDPHPHGDLSSRTTEMQLSSVSEVEKYLKENIQNKHEAIRAKAKAIKEAKASLAENKKALTEYEQTVESFLTDWK